MADLPFNPISLAGGVVDAGLGIFNTIQNYKNNKWSQKFQEDMFNWNKEVQQETWKREDNAIQRRVQDLTKAGFNPLSALSFGGAEAGAIGNSTGVSPLEQDPASYSFQKTLDNAYESQLTSANIGQTVKNTEYIDNQIDNVVADTKIKKEMPAHVRKQIQNMDSQIKYNQANTLKNQAERQKVMSEIGLLEQKIEEVKLAQQVAKYNYKISRNMNLRTTDAMPKGLDIAVWAGKSIGEGLSKITSKGSDKKDVRRSNMTEKEYWKWNDETKEYELIYK